MKKEVIKTSNAPEALGPYSQGIKINNLIFVSCQIGINPSTQEIVEGGIEAQTKQIFKNIRVILEETRADLSNVAKVTVFLKDMGDFKKVNEIYSLYFGKPYPARSVVAVKELPKSVDIGIEVFAAI